MDKMAAEKRSNTKFEYFVVGKILSFNAATSLIVFRDLNEEVFSAISLIYIKAMARAAVQDEHLKTQIMDIKIDMFEGLEFAMKESYLHIGMASLLSALNIKGPNFILSIKNNLFYKNSDKLPEKYLTLWNRFYGPPDTLLKRQRHQNVATATHSEVNRWISKQSRGTITDVISKSNFEEFTDFLLVNCVYFSGEWDFDFSKSKNIKVRNFRTQGCTFIEVPYKDSEFCMIFIYPDDLYAYRKLTNYLSYFEVMMEGFFMKSEIEFVLPEGVFQSDARLQHLMLLKACDDVNGKRSVTQKVYMEITKKGTKAAAVTVLNQSVPEPQAKKGVQNELEPIIFILYNILEEVVIFVGSNIEN